MNAPGNLAQVTPALRSLDLIHTLVGYDTTSRDSNLALIDWIRDYLEGHGFAATLTFDDDRRKANLFATLAAVDGNATTGGIVLSGHTDVVPVDNQPWESDPFIAHAARRPLVRARRHRHEELLGRGPFVRSRVRAPRAAQAPALRALVRRGSRMHRRAEPHRRHRRPRLAPGRCIVGEPTGMELVVAHKGKKAWRCRVRGFEAHSSLTPHGVNAVQIACEIVAYIAQRARAFRDAGTRDDAYDVPYTTTHVGIIRGGTALNIVPRDCTFDFEIRHLPFDDPDLFIREVEQFAAGFLPAMHAVDASTYIEFDHLSRSPDSTRTTAAR
jgi:acetylornithine deacetylase